MKTQIKERNTTRTDSDSPEGINGTPNASSTPGPWWTSELDTVLAGDENDPQVIALTYGDIMCVENPDEAKANARLIASAPDLLEALKALLSALRTPPVNSLPRIGTPLAPPSHAQKATSTPARE